MRGQNKQFVVFRAKKCYKKNDNKLKFAITASNDTQNKPDFNVKLDLNDYICALQPTTYGSTAYKKYKKISKIKFESKKLIHTFTEIS